MDISKEFIHGLIRYTHVTETSFEDNTPGPILKLTFILFVPYYIIN